VPRSYQALRQRCERVLFFLRRDIWLLEVEALPAVRAWLTRLSRVLLITARGFFRDRCLQRAAALTYSTIFSLPPVLAFTFAAAKGFNVYRTLKERTIEPFLDATFGARGSGAAPELRTAVDQIFTYVETTDLKALGGFAFAFMLYSVINLLGVVEGTLNDIWGVRRARSWMRRVSDYLAIVVIAPIFLITAAVLTTFLQGREIPLAWGGGSIKVLPLLAVWFGLGFAYLTLPNTGVRVSSALLGGVVAGSVWQGVQVLHLSGQIGLARYNAIYASFAAIPMLLLWIYLSWSVFLLGAELSFAHQNEPMFTSMARTGKVDQLFRERIAPRLAGRITAAFLEGRAAPTAAELASELGIAPRTVTQVLETLVAAKLLARSSEGLSDGYLPARDPETITVLDLLHALRHEEDASSPPVRNKLDERVDRLLGALDEENVRSLHNYTLSELGRTLAEGGESAALEGLAAPRAARDLS
jgi:membrane protein